MPSTLLRRMPKPDEPKLLRRLCRAIIAGHSLTGAAPIAGIGAATASEWNSEGLAQLAGTTEPGSHAVFAKAVEAAQSTFARRNLAVLNVAKAKSWQAGAWLLERRMPQDYAQRRDINVQSTQLSISVSLPREALPALLRMTERFPLPQPTETPPALPPGPEAQDAER